MTIETMNSTDVIDRLEYKAEESEQYNPTEKEEAEVKRFMSLFYTFKRYRKRYDQRWLDFYKIVRGSHWDSKRPRWKNSEVVNMIWPTLQSQIPLQTDVRPRFTFLPMNPADQEFSEILDQIAESDFERFNWLRVVYEVLYDSWVYGHGLASVFYDQDIDDSVGAATFHSEDVFNFYPHPDSNTVNDQDSDAVFIAKPTATDKVKERFPDKAKYIKSDITDKLKKSKADVKNTQSNHFNSDRDLAELTYGTESDSSTDDIPRTMVFEGFFKPREAEEKTDEAGAKYWQKKYPQGRRMVVANNMLLLDGPLPYDDGLFPFAKLNNYILPREFYGVSEVEQLESPQYVFNKMLCFFLDAMALTGNPIWIVDTNAAVDVENLSNIPGSVVEKSPGSEVRREQGVALNPSALSLLDSLMGWFNVVSGQGELSRGDAPGGVTAASAIEQLIKASKTRIRQKQRNLDEFLKDCGRLYMSRVFEFYTVPKIYRITEKDGSQTFRKFRIETDGDKKIAVFSDYQKNDHGLLSPLPERQLELAGKFDVRVQTGSDLPFEQADTERKVLQLFDRQIIDAEEVLDKLQYPNKEKILQRISQKMAAAQEQQPQQGA